MKMNGETIVKDRPLRNTSLDVIRGIAVLFVVMIHCSAVFVDGFEDVAFGFMTGNIFDSLSRPGVPLFLMISGALMLDEVKEKSISDMLNTAKRILILIILWSLAYSMVYNIIFPIMQGKSISIVQFVKSTINGHFHIWYLYMLVGVYLITPFLRMFVKKENKNLILLYFAISLSTTFIKPVVNVLSFYFDELLYVNTFIEKFYLDFFGCFITYYIVGWYIVHIGVNKKWMRKLIYVFGSLSAVIIICITQLTKDHTNMYSYEGIFVFIYSVSIFLFINNIKLTPIERVQKFVLLLSKLSFGIYIIHPLINLIAGKILDDLSNPIIHILLRFTIVFAISFLISYVLSKIPVLKKLIRT